MFKPTLFEKIKHKITQKLDKILASSRKNKLNNTDFSIISNNCWGGICYEYFNIVKQSPTVGCFMMTDDYLKFIGNLDYYLGQSLSFIKIEQSKHYQEWKEDKSLQNVPIGLLDDVEIVFLHYKNQSIAKQKWEKRVKRINKKNFIFKFSYMNNCRDADVERFVNMKLPGKKICFVKNKEMSKSDDCLVYYRGFEKDKQIYNDTYYWNKYVDVERFINKGQIVQK